MSRNRRSGNRSGNRSRSRGSGGNRGRGGGGQSNKVCRYFLQGRCNRGRSCNYAHPRDRGPHYQQQQQQQQQQHHNYHHQNRNQYQQPRYNQQDPFSGDRTDPFASGRDPFRDNNQGRSNNRGRGHNRNRAFSGGSILESVFGSNVPSGSGGRGPSCHQSLQECVWSMEQDLREASWPLTVYSHAAQFGNIGTDWSFEEVRWHAYNSANPQDHMMQWEQMVREADTTIRAALQNPQAALFQPPPPVVDNLNSASMDLFAAPIDNREVCRNFLKRRCRYGNRCKYSHDTTQRGGGGGGGDRMGMMETGGGGDRRQICRNFAQRGNCRFGNRCKFSHTPNQPQYQPQQQQHQKQFGMDAPMMSADPFATDPRAQMSTNPFAPQPSGGGAFANPFAQSSSSSIGGVDPFASSVQQTSLDPFGGGGGGGGGVNPFGGGESFPSSWNQQGQPGQAGGMQSMDSQPHGPLSLRTEQSVLMGGIGAANSNAFPTGGRVSVAQDFQNAFLPAQQQTGEQHNGTSAALQQPSLFNSSPSSSSSSSPAPGPVPAQAGRKKKKSYVVKTNMTETEAREIFADTQTPFSEGRIPEHPPPPEYA